MKFAGDAIIVAFYATATEVSAPDQGLRSATMRSVRCAAELSAKCGELSCRFEIGGQCLPGEVIKLHGGVFQGNTPRQFPVCHVPQTSVYGYR